MRIERKFVVGEHRESEVLAYLYEHDFFRQHEDRTVNSIYFDTPTLDYYRQNLDGVSVRQKARVRWYGDVAGVRDASLELKKKRNALGEKPIERLPEIEGIEALRSYLDTAEFRSTLLGAAGDDLVPVVHVSYERRYFVHQNGVLRATVDVQVRGRAFEDVGPPENPRVVELGKCILELKYSSDLDSATRCASILRRNPFRLHKFSKYTESVTELVHAGYL